MLRAYVVCTSVCAHVCVGVSAPNSVKKATGPAQRQACSAAVDTDAPYASAACAKKPQLMSAPRTDMMQSEAKRGERLRRTGGQE